MQPYDKIEVRAMHTDWPEGTKRVRISVRKAGERRMHVLDVPATMPLNEQVLESLVKQKFPDCKEVIMPSWLSELNQTR